MKSILDSRPELAYEVEQVAEVAGYLWQKGWAERNGGNITVNVTHCMDNEIYQWVPISDPIALKQTLPHLKGCYFFCKGTNKRMRDLARHPMGNGSIIHITEDCVHYEIIADHPVKPTSELPAHLAMHNYLLGKEVDCKAVLHTHPIELVAMSHTEKFLEKDVLTHLLWSMIPETKAFCPKGVGIVRYELPGSQRLADATIAQLDDYDVTLWEKHGVCAVGPNIMEAFDQVDVLNKSAQIYLSAQNMGFKPDGMTKEQMQEMTKAFGLPK